MEEHKVLTGMLLVALVVSVAGSMVVVDRMGSLGVSGGLSGAATGTSDLNITQDITITLPDSAINFGSGKVDPDQDYAVLDSLGGNVSGGSWANASDDILVRNDGNVGVNVTVAFDKQSGKGVSSFACASDPGNCGEGLTATTPGAALTFAYQFVNAEAGACATDLSSSLTEISATATDFAGCGCLRSTSAEDEIGLNLEVGIPADASGNKESTITFTSTASGVSC